MAQPTLTGYSTGGQAVLPTTYESDGATPKIGLIYSTHMLGALNESGDTDAFLITSINSGKLYVNTGTSTAPIWKQIVQGTAADTASTIYIDFTSYAALDGVDANPTTATAEKTSLNTLNTLTFRSGGIYKGANRISGTNDSKLYWEPASVATEGTFDAFTVRAYNNENNIWRDSSSTSGADTVSVGTAHINITVLGVNDAPVFTLSTTQVNVNEDGGAFTVSGFVTAIGDGDAGTQTLTFTTTNDNPDLFVSGHAPTVAANGTLTYQLTPNAYGDAIITVKLADNGGTANSGVDTTTKTFTLHVSPVNDAPVNNLAGGEDQTAVAGQVVFSTGNGNALSVTDIDAGDVPVNLETGAGAIEVTLTVGSGTLDVTADLSAYTGQIDVNGDQTGTLVIRGTVGAVNAALQGLTFSGGADTLLEMYTTDLGNTGPTEGADDDTISLYVPPTVVDVIEPENDWYVQGDTLWFGVQFSTDMSVNTAGGSPELAVTIGNTTVQAQFDGTDGNTLWFYYDVQAGQYDGDGISVTTSGLIANGSSITSFSSGATAVLTLSGLDSLAGVLVDAIDPNAPSAPDLATADDSYGPSGTAADNITNIDTNVTFSGTGEANATVDVTISGMTETATINGSGAWTVDFADLSALADGDWTVSAVVTDPAGNQSKASQSTLTLDRIAPDALDAVVLFSGDDTGVSSADAITKNWAGLTFTGTADLGASVTIWNDTNNDGVLDVSENKTSVTASSLDGSFQGDLNFVAKDGTYHIVASQIDVAGNLSDASESLTLVIDTQVSAPDAPDLDSGSDSAGASNSDDITNAFDLTFTGTAEADALVTLWDDANSDGLVSSGEMVVSGYAGEDGSYSLTFSGVAETTFDIKARQTDVAGNTSGASSALTVEVDRTAPDAPTIDLITADDTAGVSNTDDATYNNDLTFSGMAEPDSTVSIYEDYTGEDAISIGAFGEDDSILGTGVADAQGTYSITISGVSEGLHPLAAFATDVAGNQSVDSETGISLYVDNTPPGDVTGFDLDASDDSAGASNTDNITFYNNGLTFSGVVTLGEDTWGSVTVNVYREQFMGFDGEDAPIWSDAVLVAEDLGLLGEDGSFSFDDATGEDTLADGKYRYSVKAEDFVGNESTNAATLEVTIDTEGPSVQYNAITWDAATNSFVIEGNGFSSLLNAGENGDTDIGSRLGGDGNDFSIDLDSANYLNYYDFYYGSDGYENINGADWFMQGDDIYAARVTDDHTLILTLAETENVGDLLNDYRFGAWATNSYTHYTDMWTYDYGTYPDNPYDGMTDFVNITSDFIGTDTAGNAGSGDVSGLALTGEQNIDNNYWVQHYFTASFGDEVVLEDDTLGTDLTQLGEDGPSAYLSTYDVNTAEIYVSDLSAADVAVYDYGSYHYLENMSWNMDSGNGSYIVFEGDYGMLASMDNSEDGLLTFADGSLLLNNWYWESATLEGGRGNDQLIAGTDGDRLLGNRGNDLLIGGAGGDAIYGGTSNDVIVGNGGNDYLSGGTGRDVFVFTAEHYANWAENYYYDEGEGHDVISDFSVSQDKIHFGDQDQYDEYYDEDLGEWVSVNLGNFITGKDGYSSPGLDYDSGADFINALLATRGGPVPEDDSFYITQAGSDTLIVLQDGAETIRLMGVNAASLTASNFEVGGVNDNVFNMSYAQYDY